MNWPHDPDGEEGSEGGRKYGLAILAKKLADEDLPVTKAAFLEAVDDHPVRLDNETIISVEDALTHMEDGPFDTREAFLTAAGDSMRTGGHWTFALEQSR